MSEDLYTFPAGPTPPPSGRRRGRTALVAVAIGGLAVGAFGLADAISAHMSNARAANGNSNLASSGTGNRPKSGFGSSAPHWGPGAGPFAGGIGPLLGRGFGGGALGGVINGVLGGTGIGTISNITSSSITVTTSSHATVTFDTTGSTHYFAMFSSTSRSSLADGDRVLVVAAPGGFPFGGRVPSWIGRAYSGSSSSSSSSGSGNSTTGAETTTSKASNPDAMAVVVVQPFATGTVVTSSSSEIVITDSGGLQRDILVGSSTHYSEAGTTVSASALKPGEEIFAYGSAASNPTELQASHVLVLGPAVAGKVKSVSGSSITITSGRNQTLTVSTGDSTVFTSGGKASSINSVKSGDLLAAIGSYASAGTLDASAVVFGSNASALHAGSAVPAFGQGLLGGSLGSLSGGLLGGLLGY
jgi:hypothetical protein